MIYAAYLFVAVFTVKTIFDIWRDTGEIKRRNALFVEGKARLRRQEESEQRSVSAMESLSRSVSSCVERKP